MASTRTLTELQMLQALPLEVKIRKTQERLREWVDYFGLDGVYVSFSGGKDSTVLLTIARQMYPGIKAVFVDTGLEFPEIRQFVKTWDNVDWIKPKMTFKQVVEKYGYPFISKEVSEVVFGARKFVKNKLSAIENKGGVENCSKVELMDILECGRCFGKGHKGDCSRYYGSLTTGVDKNGNYSIAYNMANHSSSSDYGKLCEIANSVADTQYDIRPSKPKKSMFSATKYAFFLDSPFEISNQCCNVMKKNPAREYHRNTGRVPITAMMASESRLRTQKWLNQGCNAFDSNKPVSNPMSFWTEQDVLLYIYLNHVPIASVYGEVVEETCVDGQVCLEDLEIFDLRRPTLKTTGRHRTGCFACMYGAHLEKGQSQLQKMHETHPKIYDWLMRPVEEGGLDYKTKIDWINEHGNIHISY